MNPRDSRPSAPGADTSLTGSLLLAHPAMHDPHFRKSVILLAAHSATDGAMGVILNRPRGHTLGESDVALAPAPIGALPIYEGGPVDTARMIFAGWHWDGPHRRFQVNFGLDREAAETLRGEQPEGHLRAFVGHAGWAPGQLEKELHTPTWIVTRVSPDKLDTLDGRDLWRALVKAAAPGLTLLADAPDDPDMN